ARPRRARDAPRGPAARARARPRARRARRRARGARRRGGAAHQLRRLRQRRAPRARARGAAPRRLGDGAAREPVGPPGAGAPARRGRRRPARRRDPPRSRRPRLLGCGSPPASGPGETPMTMHSQRARPAAEGPLDLDAGLARLGFASFRPGQREAVETLLRVGRLLLVAPTGGGKSLVYQLPACLLPGTALVVSPLIALMHDQVAALAARGVAATY